MVDWLNFVDLFKELFIECLHQWLFVIIDSCCAIFLSFNIMLLCSSITLQIVDIQVTCLFILLSDRLWHAELLCLKPGVMSAKDSLINWNSQIVTSKRITQFRVDGFPMLGFPLVFKCSHKFITCSLQALQVNLGEIYTRWQRIILIKADFAWNVLINDRPPLVSIVVCAVQSSHQGWLWCWTSH